MNENNKVPFVINKSNDNYVKREPIDRASYENRKLEYPYSDDYNYEFRAEIIDLDKECEKDLRTNNGFRITHKQKTNQNIKNPDSIYSQRYGQDLQDEHPYQERTRCKCGKTVGKLNANTTCPYCHTVVKTVGSNFSYFGWIILDRHYIIHPTLYNHIKSFIGKKAFEDIIRYTEDIDQDGNIVQKEYKSVEDSFKGIGIMEFKNRFDEIMTFYANKHKTKTKAYEFIMKNKDKVFIHCIPVYTLLLRPIKIKDGHFFFEGNNGAYNIIAGEAEKLNSNSNITNKKKEEAMLYHIMEKFNNSDHIAKNSSNISDNIDLILAGKKGAIRSLFGGNYNFISRCVIIPDPSLKVDEISLPYACLIEMMKELVINNLQRMYNSNYTDAYMRWYDGVLKVDPVIVSILETIIRDNDTGRGIPVLINRNPTLRYGSIMQMYCVKINVDSYAEGLPLQILTPLNADFDGDVMNCLWIINKQFLKEAEKVFNPRNAMFIDRDNGYVASEMCHSRETILNANNMIRLAIDSYTPEEIATLERIKEANNGRYR